MILQSKFLLRAQGHVNSEPERGRSGRAPAGPSPPRTSLKGPAGRGKWRPADPRTTGGDVRCGATWIRGGQDPVGAPRSADRHSAGSAASGPFDVGRSPPGIDRSSTSTPAAQLIHHRAPWAGSSPPSSGPPGGFQSPGGLHRIDLLIGQGHRFDADLRRHPLLPDRFTRATSPG
jgi:hypothetical protein